MITKQKKEREADIPSSSIADIAFLLLVFFMVTTTIESQKGMFQKLAENNAAPKEVTILTKIMINENGIILIDGRLVSKEDLYSRFKSQIIEYSETVFSLSTNENTKYSEYIYILDQLNKAKVKNIYFENE